MINYYTTEKLENESLQKIIINKDEQIEELQSMLEMKEERVEELESQIEDKQKLLQGGK